MEQGAVVQAGGQGCLRRLLAKHRVERELPQPANQSHHPDASAARMLILFMNLMQTHGRSRQRSAQSQFLWHMSGLRCTVSAAVTGVVSTWHTTFRLVLLSHPVEKGPVSANGGNFRTPKTLPI